MQRIKITFVLPSTDPGGAERVFLNIINNLDRSRFKLSLVLLQSKGPLLKSIRPDVEVINIGVLNIKYAIVRLLLIFAKLKPDIIFSTHSHINVSILASKLFLPKNVKVIIRESSIPSQKFKSGIKNKFIRILYKIYYRCANFIISPGKEISKELLKITNVNPSKIYEIPNPVDSKTIRRKMILPVQINIKKEKLLVAVGSLRPPKGFDLLISAMDTLIKYNGKIRLIIIGDGNEKLKLVNLIKNKNLDNFVFLKGFKDNVYPYIYRSDIFILSSRYEGMPNVVLESLACGTPVVAFDCPGCVREIIGGNEHSKLVEPGNLLSLTNGILELLSRNKSNVKENLLPKRFTLDEVIKKYDYLFNYAIK